MDMNELYERINKAESRLSEAEEIIRTLYEYFGHCPFCHKDMARGCKPDCSLKKWLDNK